MHRGAPASIIGRLAARRRAAFCASRSREHRRRAPRARFAATSCRTPGSDSARTALPDAGLRNATASTGAVAPTQADRRTSHTRRTGASCELASRGLLILLGDPSHDDQWIWREDVTRAASCSARSRATRRSCTSASHSARTTRHVLHPRRHCGRAPKSLRREPSSARRAAASRRRWL